VTVRDFDAWAGAAAAVWLVLTAGCAGAPLAPSPSDRAESPPPPTEPPPPSQTPQPPTEPPGITPTIDAIGTVVAAQEPKIAGSFASPDERWLVEILIYDCVLVGEDQENAYQALRLTQVETGEQRTADSQFIHCGGLGAFGLAGRFWSPDSRYFYYTNASTGVPDGCGFFSSPYLRLDTLDLSVEYLGMGAVSPDGGLLAVWWEGDSDERVYGMLAIWDIQGGLLGIGQIPPPIVLPGPIAWSPDSRSVAFLTSQDYCPLGLTALGGMQLDRMVPVIILQSINPSFGGLAWELPHRLELTDEQGGAWSYDFATRDLLPAEP
jgi:hypothetical protein